MTDPALYLFIDGEPIGPDARETLPVVDPATGLEFAGLPVTTEADVDRALDAAARTFPAWRETPAVERGRILRRAAALLRERAGTIAEIMTREQGGILARSRTEVLRSADVLDWCAEEGRRAYGRIIPTNTAGVRQLVLREPIGPAVALTPWNAPAFMPARKIGYAFTRSARVADDLMRALECGLLGINTFAVTPPESPVAGVKLSGHGAEGGTEGLDSYLVTRFVAHAPG